jgi:hypothetical protein
VKVILSYPNKFNGVSGTTDAIVHLIS